MSKKSSYSITNQLQVRGEKKQKQKQKQKQKNKCSFQ